MCLNVLPGLILYFCSAVQPDPPFGLNWTLMNISLTGSHFDAMLSWRPPATADVETGWIALQYDAQYRQAGAERWEQVGGRAGSLGCRGSLPTISQTYLSLS